MVWGYCDFERWRGGLGISAGLGFMAGLSAALWSKREPALVVALVALSLATMPASTAQADGPGYTQSDGYFPSGDGTRLHAWIFRPDVATPATRTPVIVR